MLFFCREALDSTAVLAESEVGQKFAKLSEDLFWSSG